MSGHEDGVQRITITHDHMAALTWLEAKNRDGVKPAALVRRAVQGLLAGHTHPDHNLTVARIWLRYQTDRYREAAILNDLMTALQWANIGLDWDAATWLAENLPTTLKEITDKIDGEGEGEDPDGD